METKKIITERRSVNYFDKTKSIEDKLIKDIIDLAVFAPSAFNLQPWRILVLKSEESKQRLYKVANNQDKILDASVNFLLIGNKNAWDGNNPAWGEMLKSFGSENAVNGAKQAAAHLYGSSEERKLKFAESNTGLLAMSIMIAAKDFGVDSHPMSGIDFEAAHKEFKLKPEETVVMNLALGYFDTSKSLYPRRPRLGFDVIATVL